MSKFFHQVASIFGPLLALAPQVVPFLPSHVGNVLLSVTGIVTTLVADVSKALATSPPTDKGV